MNGMIYYLIHSYTLLIIITIETNRNKNVHCISVHKSTKGVTSACLLIKWLINLLTPSSEQCWQILGLVLFHMQSSNYIKIRGLEIEFIRIRWNVIATKVLNANTWSLLINSMALREVGLWYKNSNFQTHIKDGDLVVNFPPGQCLKTPLMIGQNFLGNGLVLSGNKSSPEAMLTEIYVTMWRH